MTLKKKKKRKIHKITTHIYPVDEQYILYMQKPSFWFPAKKKLQNWAYKGQKNMINMMKQRKIICVEKKIE